MASVLQGCPPFSVGHETAAPRRNKGRFVVDDLQMNYASDNSQVITLALRMYIVRDATSWILEGSESNNLDSREFRRAH
jgi:hypothetical protein